MAQANDGGMVKTLSLLRITMGWMFFWAFIDKVWGLGFATAAGKGWLDGVSPTAGFLGHAVKGPFVGIFHAMAGNVLVDWLFMLGLLGVGLSLMLGIYVRIASYSGMAIVTLMYLSLLPPVQNPLIDDHVVFFFLFYLFTQVPTVGETYGLGKWWKKMDFVKQYPILE